MPTPSRLFRCIFGSFRSCWVAPRKAPHPVSVGRDPDVASEQRRLSHPIEIVLEAAAGETARGMFLVENLLPNPVKGQIVATSLRGSAAGDVDLAFSFEPPVAALNPRDQLLAQLSVVIPDFLTPGVSYAGEIAIPELKGTAIPLIVRRLSPEAV